jgi:hypothetical protein
MFKIFLNLLGVTRTRIRILGSGSVKIFIKTAKCKWFRIRTWSGSANHTKLNANAPGSGFRNFYADSGSDWARTSLVCKGYPASRSSVRSRECYALQPDHAIQVRQVPNPQIPCLPLPSYEKLPWTYPAWKGIHFSPACRFGVFFSGWLDALYGIFMQISLSF